MTDNTVNNVYMSRIHEIADSYIYNLADGDTKTAQADRESAIKKTPIFKGMLKDIYNNIFKITDKDKKYNNKACNVDYGDIDTLNDIWDIYTGLCYKYCQNPTMLNFSLMTGISTDTFNEWERENSRGFIYYDLDGNRIKDLPLWIMNHQGEEYKREVSSSHSDSVKRWLKECESAAYDVAMSGNPGGMFILKANYGYTEAPRQIQMVGGDKPIQQAAEIAATYGVELTENSSQLLLPDAPDDD